tara:strand:+ start:12333 stop:12755 length:423 start_codon:yes stop_codon:yes gene_type:complete
MKILILHGPNLNLLGKRQPDIYGYETQDELITFIKKSFSNINFSFLQSNHEGVIIDKIHESIDLIDAIIINPGAFAHYSYAIRDAIAILNIPIIEVHLSDINNRANFRKQLVLSEVCNFTISGKGKNGYIDAVNKIKELI